jgi:dolichol-phosphate mannosyltransferase
MRFLVAIPVHNEADHIHAVIPRVQEHADDILAIDDGSTDGTAEKLAAYDVTVIRHEINRGYGAALRSAFEHAIRKGYDWVLTMDCDGQHEPASIPAFRERAARGGVDLISGTRYTGAGRTDEGDEAPSDRRAINRIITAELNERLSDRLGEGITDGFCGFKAHRTRALRELSLDEDGYAFPMQLWVQTAAAGHRVEEIPVQRIYNDPSRSFGGVLDDPETRLEHYRRAMHCELERCADRLPASASSGSASRCR